MDSPFVISGEGRRNLKQAVRWLNQQLNMFWHDYDCYQFYGCDAPYSKEEAEIRYSELKSERDKLNEKLAETI